MQRRGRFGLAIAAVALGALLTVMFGMVGVAWPTAIAWGLALIVLITLVRTEPLNPDSDWPPLAPPRRKDNSEVARLAWSFDSRNDEAGPIIRRRLRALVQRQLLWRGIDLDDEAGRGSAETLLGPEIIKLLSHDRINRTDVERVLNALESLEKEDSK